MPRRKKTPPTSPLTPGEDVELERASGARAAARRDVPDLATATHNLVRTLEDVPPVNRVRVLRAALLLIDLEVTIQEPGEAPALPKRTNGERAFA